MLILVAWSKLLVAVLFAATVLIPRPLLALTDTSQVPRVVPRLPETLYPPSLITKDPVAVDSPGARLAALPVPSPPPEPPVGYTAPQQSLSPSGTCGEWLQAAGVSDTADAMAIIILESDCNPNAVNVSSGACGVAQELPCGKSGCRLGDGACQVAWMNRYVISRYGSWANAVAHEHTSGWY